MAAEGVLGAATKIANIAAIVNQLTSDKDNVEINGRMIAYEVKGHFYKWKFVWDCVATDKQSGVSVKSKGWQAKNGSLEHAFSDLMKELANKGLL